MNMDHSVVTRIPPSPTGHLHIGTARTALYNYLFAKHHGGVMMFRSEDTDRERSTRAFEDEIVAGLSWLGLSWANEGALYRQSENTARYREHLEALIANGHAYIATEPSKRDPSVTVEVVRLRNPNKTITFHDIIRGDITFDTTELGDTVIARSLDDALYHFTVVVDDHHMGVTHVIRGEDHISNTPRQILIQEALGLPRPVYAHLPLILAADRSKMSKRHGAVSLSAYQDAGFLPAAIINYLALLGWNPGTEQELFTLDELIEAFTLEKVNKSGAVFDLKKFTWFNKAHLAELSVEAFTTYLRASTVAHPLLSTSHIHTLTALLPTIRERTHTRSEFEERLEAGEYDFAITAPEYAAALLRWKKDPDSAAALPRLRACAQLLTDANFDTIDSIKAVLLPYADTEGRGEVLWPLRIALSGRPESPDPFTIAHIIGRDETLTRIATACDKLEGDVTT